MQHTLPEALGFGGAWVVAGCMQSELGVHAAVPCPVAAIRAVFPDILEIEAVAGWAYKCT